MTGFARAAHLLDKAVGLLASAAVGLAALSLLVSMVLIGWAVGMRYLLNSPVPWVDELVGYLLVAIVMLAAADALRRGEHIAVDVLTGRLGPRGRRLAAAAGLLAVGACGLVLITSGWGMADFSRDLGIRSTGWLATPMWLPQILVPLGGGILLLATLARLLRMAAAGGEAFDPDG